MSFPRAVCVYCGSSEGVSRHHFEAAAEFGRLLAGAGIRLVYGGGGLGMMGRLADAALAAGGRVTGIIPKSLVEREWAHAGLDELIEVDSMHARKRVMAERSDGFVILPGGIGTLDEMFEIVSWRQLGLHDKPIVLVDLDGYWAPLLEMLDRIVADGFAPLGGHALFQRVATPQAALDHLAQARETRQGFTGSLA